MKVSAPMWLLMQLTIAKMASRICYFNSFLQISYRFVINKSCVRFNSGKKVTTGITGLGKKVAKGKLGPSVEKKLLPVETDPYKLVNYVCGSNYMKTGEDIKLKPDEEYPEWLWNIRTGKPPPIEEMDPDSEEYWSRVRTLARRHKMQLLKGKKRF